VSHSRFEFSRDRSRLDACFFFCLKILCSNTRRTSSFSLHFRNGTDRGNESSVLRRTEAPQTPSCERALGLCDWVRRLSCLQNRAIISLWRACLKDNDRTCRVLQEAGIRLLYEATGFVFFYFGIYYHLLKSFVSSAGPALGTSKVNTCLGRHFSHRLFFFSQMSTDYIK